MSALGFLGFFFGHALLDLEDALVEVGRLGLRPARVGRRGQRDAALARVQLRADRDVGGALERHEPSRPRRCGARRIAGRVLDRSPSPETTFTTTDLPGTGGGGGGTTPWFQMMVAI